MAIQATDEQDTLEQEPATNDWSLEPVEEDYGLAETEPAPQQVTAQPEATAEPDQGWTLEPVEEDYGFGVPQQEPVPVTGEEGFLRQAADVPLKIGESINTSLRGLTDLFGADNAISQNLTQNAEWYRSLLSAQALEDEQEIGRILQEAENEGVLGQLGAGLEAFSVAPVDFVASGIGSLAVFAATGVAGRAAAVAGAARAGLTGAKAAQFVQRGVQATQLATGAGMGAGIVKGEIYQSVKDEMLAQGKTEEEAKQIAMDAQSYMGKNLDQILIGAGLGTIDAFTGAEKIIGKVLTKGGLKPDASRIGNILKNGITEAAPEFVQAAQEKFASNLALQREGVNVPLTQGVFSQGALEGLVGLGLGVGAGAIEPRIQTEPTKEEVSAAAAETQDVARRSMDVAPATASLVEGEAEQLIIAATVTPRREGETDAEWRARTERERAETPEQRVARLQREAQEAAGEIELEEEPPVAGLPPIEPTPPVTPAPEAAAAPVEPVVAAEGARPPVTPEVVPKAENAVVEAEQKSEQESDTVKVFRGVAEAGALPTGGAFFTDSERDASAYAQLAALRKAVEENEDFNDIVSEVMAEEGANDITDLSINTIKSIIEGNNIQVGDISEGAVLRGNIRLGNVLNLESFGSEVGSLPETWNELNELGLVPETWESLDEDVQEELSDKYRGKAFYSLLEGEVNLNDQFAKGIDTIVFTDQNTEGKGTHRTYLTKAAEQFAQEAAPAAVEPTPVTPPVTPEVDPAIAAQKAIAASEISGRTLGINKANQGVEQAREVAYNAKQEASLPKTPVDRAVQVWEAAGNETKYGEPEFAAGELRFAVSGGYDKATNEVKLSNNPKEFSSLTGDSALTPRSVVRHELGHWALFNQADNDLVGRLFEWADTADRTQILDPWHGGRAGVAYPKAKFDSRDELVSEAYSIWKSGGTVPQEVIPMLQELDALVPQNLQDRALQFADEHSAKLSAPTAIPQLEPLRRVARAEQTEEDVAGLVDAGFVEVYNGQPVITQAGIDALPEAERPRLTPEARKIQIDTRTSEAAAEAISKNLRIGVDQVPVDVRMPAGWTLVGDVYVPPTVEAAPALARLEPKIEADLRSQVVSGFEARSKRHKEFSEGLNKAVAANSLTEDGAILLREVFKDADPKLLGRATISINSRRRYLGMALRRGGTQLTENAIEKALDGRFGGNMTPEVMAMVVTHEIGHHGYNSILTKKERALIGSIFTKMGEKGRMEFFSRGAIEKPFQVKYHAKNQHEFFAQSFAEYVFSDRLPDPEIKPIFDRIIQKLKQAFQTLMNRNANIEQLVPLYEKLLGAAPTPEVREARREPAITPQRFYSQLQRTVEAKMPNVSSPEQLKAIIDPTRGSGVKPEEVKWSGITEAIDRIASENNGRVPKEAVLKYLRDEGAVKFEEVTLLEKIQITPEQNRQIQEEANRVWEQWVDEAVEEAEERGMTRGMEVDRTDVSNNLNRSWDEAESEAMRILGISEEPQTKYQEYQLPEGENYREVVMAMPEGEMRDAIVGPSGNFIAWADENDLSPTGMKVLERASHRIEKRLFGKTKYKSPHFANIPNYVAHMRLNDRKDSDGKNGTFIEEIQSDLHQKAREVGYKDQNIVRQNFVSWLKSNKKELSEQEIQTQFRTQVGEEIQQWLKDQEIAARNDSAVPDAPFRKDWPIQMFKRALEQAVMSGKDWIGWTTGETQAARYDLSKNISEVAYNVDSESLFAYDKDGNNVLFESNVTYDKIADYIGKEAAERLSSSKIEIDRGGAMQRLKGEDLKVGGEGMAGFYDNILPKEIAKYVKKWGATVEKSKLDDPDEAMTYEGLAAEGLTMREYNALPRDEAEALRKKYTTGTPIWRVNITPEMRQIIQEEGQAVFLRRLRGEPMAGMEQAAVEARLQELGFPTGGIIRVVNEPDADFEGRTIILDGKVTGIELNASAIRDNAAIDRVLNHEFAESANADGALNKLVENLTPKEKKEINDTITRLRYEERARTTEEAARAIETLAEAWKGRGFFTRAVARVEAWASKLGFKLTRRAAEYIAARNLADINSGFRVAYNQFINVRGEVREGRAEDQAVVDADMGRRSQTELTPQEIDQLEKGEKIRVYRAMQIIDGKLYPPMSALVGGKLRKPTEIGAWEKAEERPDLLDKKGKFVLQKGNKTTVPAAYNPYFHTSSSPLNDQFSSAYKRDNLVTVEVEIPASELTSGYKAEGAKDAVGEVRWNAGPVSSKLPADKKRRVFLSRYAKVVRIVPDSEVAEVISGLLEGTNLSIPENTVTPSLRSELEKRGVAVTPRPARGQEIRESRREPEAIPTFTEGTPESATLKEMEASMAKVDAASEAKGGKPETYKISEIASVWMDSGLGERELQDAIVEYTNLTPANAARVAKAIAKQYGLQQQIAETGAVIAEIAPEPEGAPRKSAVTKLIEQTTGVRKPVVKLQVSESAALKKQIQLKAREARETRKARKEAAEELAKSITDYVKANPIRGPINSRQAMSITKKALKLDVNNEAAVDRFEMYVERVIENANYDQDLADARALIKRAKAFAKAKGTEGNVKVTLEAIANVAPTLLNNPFEFNLVVQRYLLGLAPVTAKQYAVMPDADVRRYLESLETQIKDNQEVLDRSKAQRILDKQAAYAEEKGIPLDEAIAILNSEEFLQEKTIEKLEDLTKLLTAMAQESQKDVKAYDDSGATPKQKELISFMRKVNLDSLINEEKKRYIRFANNLLANGATFGMEQFQSIALGQEAAMKAAKDKRLSNKLAAWISPIGGDKAIDTARRIALRTQSEADTFKNIFGREAVGAFRNILGLNRLDVAQTDSNRAKEQIANEFGEYFKGLRKKYGDDATGFEAKGYAGIAGYLIQTDGNKTEAESIPYRRRLMEQNIVELRKSDKQADLAEADLKERALAQLTGATNAEILSQLKALNPASYEQLMWVKDVMLPKWRDFLKEHDENFRNQANNYNNPDHLTITYKFPEGQLLPSEMEDVYQQDMIGMRIKQAANSIKRKDHPNLPVSKTGTIANIDINFGYNQYNALVDQVDKAFVAPAWEQVVAFTKAPEFERVMGGRANALFVKNILRDIQTSRSRQSITDDEAQLIAGGVRLARKISTQAVLGGITQPLRQVPDQLAKLFFTTGRFDLIIKNLLATAQAAPLLNKFPIGRRGDAQAGTQYASQFNELARKVEASVTDRKWAQYRELMNKVGEFWMTPLRGSDVWAAKVSWMSYYEAELNKKGIKMESWERESELVDTDQDRKEAASYAEFAVDFYGGASDPTKMAALSKQSNNGWKEFAKLVFLPLNSFALQQKNSLISDLRDAYLRTGDRKASIAAIAGTLAGMAAFHGMRIYIIGGLIYPAGKALLMGIFGIDMDEPDEEEKQKQLEDNWRKFKASMYGNIIAGGAGEFAEKAAIDAVNRTAYLWDANINPDSLLNDKGEIMSFRQYEKEVSPLYRFRSYGSSEYSFGLADVLTEQATHALAETQQLMTPEEMEKYTGNEQAYAAFATAVEWMYFFRLMDTDVKRIATDLKRQMDKGIEEREKELKRIREGS